MWGALFTATNLLAMAGWLLLVAGPRKPAVHSLIMYLGVAVLCLTYAVMFALLLSGAVDPVRMAGAGQPGFGSIEGVRALFASDAGVVIGWTHYLAFDLFIGSWEVENAATQGIPHWLVIPCLFLTLMLGPIGLLLYFAIRTGKQQFLAK